MRFDRPHAFAPSVPANAPGDAGAPSPGRSRRTTRGRTAHHAGLCAEDCAHAAYGARGGRILARRYRTPDGEIDLVVAVGGVTCFVEVKRRRRNGPDSPVSPRAWSRIAAAASHWLAGEEARGNRTPVCRFDAVIVDAEGRPSIIEDAWRPAA